MQKLKTKLFFFFLLVLISTFFPVISSAQILTGGANYSLAICDDGNTVLAFGLNDTGQLGNGTTKSNNGPLKVSKLQGITKVAAGWNYSLGLKKDGTVWAWGKSHGINNTPAQIESLSDVIDIAAQSYESYILKKDGTVWWTKRHHQAERTPLKDVTAIAAGYSHSLALKNDGTVWAWGHNRYGQVGVRMNNEKFVTPIQVDSLSRIIAISGGAQHSLALKDDGTVWAWGHNRVGELRNGNHNDSYIPVQVINLNNVIAIAAGRNHSLALKSDGTVWAWGANNSGQLGKEKLPFCNTPIKVSYLTNVIAIGAGENHSLAKRKDNTFWAWGNNLEGQLGSGDNSYRNIPIKFAENCTPTTIGSPLSYAAKCFPKKLMVAAENLNFRSEPNTNSQVIDQLDNSELLTFLDIKRFRNDRFPWLKVKRDMTGEEGYVLGKYILSQEMACLNYNDADRMQSGNWYGIYKEGDEIKIEKATPTIEPMDGMDEEYHSIISKNKHKIIICSQSEIKEGKINGQLLQNQYRYFMIGSHQDLVTINETNFSLICSGDIHPERGYSERRNEKVIFATERFSGSQRFYKEQDLSEYIGQFGEYGYRILFAGDLNNDGIPELIISEGTTHVGAVYYFQSNEKGELELQSVTGSSSKC